MKVVFRARGCFPNGNVEVVGLSGADVKRGCLERFGSGSMCPPMAIVLVQLCSKWEFKPRKIISLVKAMRC